MLGLLGSNGAGKSTFMNIVLGLIKCDYGDVFLGNIKLTMPNFASFDFDIRYLPTQDPYEILDDVKEFVGKSVLPELTLVSTSPSVDIAMHPGETIPLNTSEDEMVAELARWLTGQDKIQKVGVGTEAGYFQKAGIPTVVCGPGHIDQAHQPDEFIEMQQVALCEEFFHRLTSRLCTGRL